MRIGILGSGLMGGKHGTIFARAGHDVVFSYARNGQKLSKLARDAKGKARAGTPAEAARDADALLLAVRGATQGQPAESRLLRRRRGRQESGCPTDPRRRLRSGGRRTAADGTLTGTVHTPDRSTRLRDEGRPGAGISVRAVLG